MLRSLKKLNDFTVLSEDKASFEDDASSFDEGDQQTKESYDLLISEEEAERREAQDADVAEDLGPEESFDTQHGEGHTYNPHVAQDQWLTYTPPTDPPTLPGDSLDTEIAAGFGHSMEARDPAVEDLPARINNNDLDLQDDVQLVLRNNSETSHLTELKIQVDQGIVTLLGSVPSEADIARVDDIVRALDGVVGIKNQLQVTVE